MQELKNRIRGFIAERLTIFDDHRGFADDDNIFSLGFVDSMFALQLVMFVEESFSIKVANEDLKLDNFHSVDKLARFVQLKLDNDRSP